MHNLLLTNTGIPQFPCIVSLICVGAKFKTENLILLQNNYGNNIQTIESNSS
jgi:hypothetical protein